MPAPRRPLLPLAAVGCLGLLPGCLLLPPAPAPITPKDWKPPGGAAATETPAPTKFAELLPARPGERIARHPAADPVPAAARRPDPLPEAVVAASDPPAAPPPLPTFAPVPESPAEPESPVVAALKACQQNRLDKALDHLKAMDKANQDLVLALLPALVRATQIDLAKADPAEVAVLCEQLQAAACGLETRAALRVEKAAFCRRVSGFGKYDPWPEGQPFHPNEPAELYVEIRHVPTEPAPGANGGGFVTRLATALEIRDTAGRVVEQTDPADMRRKVPVARFERTEFSRTPPKDYFVKYRFPVPPAAGTYTVVVEVKDPSSPRGSRSKPVEFRVGP